MYEPYYVQFEYSNFLFLFSNIPLSSPPLYSRVHVDHSLVYCSMLYAIVCLLFSFDHCVICPSIYGLPLPLWYRQTLPMFTRRVVRVVVVDYKPH
jgi:hypothetical protein